MASFNSKITFVAGNKSFIAGNKGFVAGNKSFTASNKGITAGNKRFIAGIKNLVAGNKGFIAGNKSFAAGNKSLVAGNKNLIYPKNTINELPVYKSKKIKNTKNHKIANGPFQRTNTSSEPTNGPFWPFFILPKKGVFWILLKNQHPFFGEFGV